MELFGRDRAHCKGDDEESVWQPRPQDKEVINLDNVRYKREERQCRKQTNKQTRKPREERSSVSGKLRGREMKSRI